MTTGWYAACCVSRRMSFFLKGNARELRFTGETRSVGEPEERPPSLGKPRERRMPFAPTSRPAPARSASSLFPAYAPARPPPPTIDPGFDESADDDQETLFRAAPISLPPAVPKAAPIPNFRSAPPGTRLHAGSRAAPTVIVRRRAAPGLPLVVWLVAAAVAGVLSFRFVPDLVTRLEPPAATPQR